MNETELTSYSSYPDRNRRKAIPVLEFEIKKLIEHGSPVYQRENNLTKARLSNVSLTHCLLLAFHC